MKLIRRFVQSTTLKVVLAVIVSVGISVPATVWAVTAFSDVPTSHPFYKEIRAVAESGIAQGFNDGTYRPSDPITRQAMAAFMERGVGRMASGVSGPNVYVSEGRSTEVAVAAIDVGATGGGTTGFVRVSGSVYVSTNAATSNDCPCTVGVRLMDHDVDLVQGQLHVPLRIDGDISVGSASLETVVAVSGDSRHRFRMIVQGQDDFGSDSLAATGSLTAIYAPLSGDGDDTLPFELACPHDDPWEDNDTNQTAPRYYFTGPTSAIACPADHDWYHDVIMEDDISVSVTVDSFSNAEGNIDVCLYTPTGNSCSTGSSDSENITVPLGASGAYVIDVFLASDAGSIPGNAYTLTASWEPGAILPP